MADGNTSLLHSVSQWKAFNKKLLYCTMDPMEGLQEAVSRRNMRGFFLPYVLSSKLNKKQSFSYCHFT